jgi:hypothetical protein
MKMIRILLKYWHDLCCIILGEHGNRIIFSCKEVTGNIDLRNKPIGFLGSFRFYMHLSICKACKNYYDFSNALQKVMSQYMKNTFSKMNIENLNRDLINKFSKK